MPATGRTNASASEPGPRLPCWRSCALACSLGSLIAPTVSAQTSYAGTWQASPLEVRIEVRSWGTDCGPRPPARSTEPGGQVQITEDGDHLRLQGAIEAHTASCWTRNRAVRRRSASAQPGSWRVACGTAEDDPRAESGSYALRSSGRDQLQFREESAYDWQLKESRCVARRVAERTLRRIGGDTAAAPRPNPQPTEPPATEPTPACTPGEPARIRLSSRREQIEPGERVCLRARVVDERGCPLADARVRWTLGHAPGLGGTLDDGCFEAASSSAEAEGDFTLTARSGSLRAEARVTVRTPDLSDLIAQRDTQAATGPLEPTEASSERAARVAARADESDGAGWLWMVLAAAALGLGMAAGGGVWFVRRGRRARTGGGDAAVAPPERLDAPERPASPGPASPGPASAAGPTSTPAASGEPSDASTRSCPVCGKEFAGTTLYCPIDGTQLPAAAGGGAGRPPEQPMVCPTCRRGFPPDARFCPHDQEELVPYALFMAERKEGDPRVGERRICPLCGGRYEPGVRFCGKDGSELVLVN